MVLGPGYAFSSTPQATLARAECERIYGLYGNVLSLFAVGKARTADFFVRTLTD
jgi:hypothetical protein